MRTRDRLVVVESLSVALDTEHAADPVQIATKAGCAVGHAIG
jgi:hypothetical protein